MDFLYFIKIQNSKFNITNTLEKLENHNQEYTLLESTQNWGRASFIGYEKISQMVINGLDIVYTNNNGLKKQESYKCKNYDDLLKKINEFYINNKLKGSLKKAGFWGGITGFISYNALEKYLINYNSKSHLPDIILRAYKYIITLDINSDEVIIAMRCNKKSNNNEKILQEEAKKLGLYDDKKDDITIKYNTKNYYELNRLLKINTNIDDFEFANKIQKAQDYIKSGDAYQIVLSRIFSYEFKESPLSCYLNLRTLIPSAYLFYFNFENYYFIGSSPEMALKIEDKIMISQPLAGTRAINKATNLKDLASDLLSDQKEIAEHIMLVDLARNDIGKNADIGSVKVEELKKILVLPNVIHISSKITGKLKQNQDIFTCLLDALPVGTLSGAPKIRAMEIINELENESRNLYGGCIFAINNAGDLDSCIAIRFIEINKASNTAKVQTGAGIVYDSNINSEINETKHKANLVLNACNITKINKS